MWQSGIGHLNSLPQSLWTLAKVFCFLFGKVLSHLGQGTIFAFFPAIAMNVNVYLLEIEKKIRQSQATHTVC